VLASTTGLGAGGDVVLRAARIELASAGHVSAASTGAGNAGTVVIEADETLTMTEASVQTSAAASAGGNIEVAVGESILLRDSTISAEAGGVTATDSGGNVTIDPDWVVLDESQIVARANTGNGGNIFIQSGFFVASARTVLDASSSQGVDGNVLIDSPNQITGTVLQLDTPPADVDALARQRCVPQLEAQRSSLTVAQRVDVGAASGNYLPSPLGDPPPAPAKSAGTTDLGTELLPADAGCR
jgi:hypothetical protein